MSKTETTETRFTPGPWRACEGNYDKPDGEYLCICGQVWSIPADQHVATVHHATHKSDPLDAEVQTHDVVVYEANARLIAASPEMYEALEWCGHVLNGVLGDPDWKDEPDAIKAYEWVHQILARVRGDKTTEEV